MSKMVSLKLNAYKENEINKLNLYILYPYQSRELMVIYVYGEDEKRPVFGATYSKMETGTNILLNVFLLILAAILCYVRRKYNLRWNGYISSIIDVNIAVIGGGNLRLNNIFERCIVGSLLIGFPFFTTFWCEMFFYPSFILHNRRIETFADLNKTNVSIFSGLALKNNERLVDVLLR